MEIYLQQICCPYHKPLKAQTEQRGRKKKCTLCLTFDSIGWALQVWSLLALNWIGSASWLVTQHTKNRKQNSLVIYHTKNKRQDSLSPHNHVSNCFILHVHERCFDILSVLFLWWTLLMHGLIESQSEHGSHVARDILSPVCPISQSPTCLYNSFLSHTFKVWMSKIHSSEVQETPTCDSWETSVSKSH